MDGDLASLMLCIQSLALEKELGFVKNDDKFELSLFKKNSKGKAVQEQILWRRRSKNRWLEGEKQTKLFHEIASVHKRMNEILAIER